VLTGGLLTMMDATPASYSTLTTAVLISVFPVIGLEPAPG